MAKLLVSDYDDTLFTDEVSLIKNIEKIKKFQEQGNCFVIATSSSFTSIMEEVKKYQIPFDYIFSNMGAGIFDADGKILYSEFIPKEEKEKIEKVLEDYPLINITRYGIIEEQEKGAEEIVGYKIKGNLEELKNLEAIFKSFLDSFEISIKEEKKLFLNYKKNTKEKAIKKLLSLFPKYKDFEIITVGDDDVDFGMLKLFDGYRMKNSSKLLVHNIAKIVSSVGELVEE